MSTTANPMALPGAPAHAKPKKKKGKLILLFVFVLLLAGGGGAAFFLAQRGIIKIPGLTPNKKAASALYAPEKDDKAKPAPAKAPAKPVTPPSRPKKATPTPAGPTIDPERGAKRLAGIWNVMEKDQLLKIAAEYPDPALALVLTKMDPEKAGEVLAGVEPKRAARLSREMERIHSVVPPQL